MSDTEIGWLIERDVGGRTVWFASPHRHDDGHIRNWTTDPNLAIRFARKLDGERVRDALDPSWQAARVEEHMWCDPSCTVPPAGWTCTRPGGHTGPCAALPIPDRPFEVASGTGAGWGRYDSLAEAIDRRDEVRRSHADVHVYKRIG